MEAEKIELWMDSVKLFIRELDISRLGRLDPDERERIKQAKTRGSFDGLVMTAAPPQMETPNEGEQPPTFHRPFS